MIKNKLFCILVSAFLFSNNINATNTEITNYNIQAVINHINPYLAQHEFFNNSLDELRYLYTANQVYYDCIIDLEQTGEETRQLIDEGGFIKNNMINDLYIYYIAHMLIPYVFWSPQEGEQSYKEKYISLLSNILNDNQDLLTKKQIEYMNNIIHQRNNSVLHFFDHPIILHDSRTIMLQLISNILEPFSHLNDESMQQDLTSYYLNVKYKAKSNETMQSKDCHTSLEIKSFCCLQFLINKDNAFDFQMI